MLKIIELLCQLPNPFSEQFDSRVCQFILLINNIITNIIINNIYIIMSNMNTVVKKKRELFPGFPPISLVMIVLPPFYIIINNK